VKLRLPGEMDASAGLATPGEAQVFITGGHSAAEEDRASLARELLGQKYRSIQA
jgi:hypothetical protein